MRSKIEDSKKADNTKVVEQELYTIIYAWS